MNTNPRIPSDEHETFALAFMIGYLGDIPDELQEVFPDQVEWSNCPEFISTPLAPMWRHGYNCGVAFFSDHALDWTEE